MSIWAWLTGSVHAQEHLYINYALTPPARELLTYSTCILDPHAQVDLKPGQQRGHHFYAYLSLVELAAGSPADEDAKKRHIPLLGQNQDWGSHLLDIRTQAWWDYLLEDVAKNAIAKGYDGFFLDTVDSAAQLPGGALAHEQRLIQFIRTLHERWPQKRIILNRGFDLLPSLKGCLTGVLVESVYQSFNTTTRLAQPQKPSDVEWIESKIRTAQALGLKVYAVDYTPVERIDLARATVKKLRTLGCVPFITTPELRGYVIAPKLPLKKE
jgi:polysaccharide biosynthesis protein PelA